MTSSNLAANSLRANASFSILAGVALLFAAPMAADLLFAAPANWHVVTFRIFGAGLLLFAIGLLVTASNPLLSRKEVLIVCAMDLGWIAGSAALVLFAGPLFTTTGIAIILLIALCIGLFALGQYLGAGRLIAPIPEVSITTDGPNLIASVKRGVQAPKDVVWHVMEDHPAYADVADNIAKVEVIKGEGLGMVRRCSDPKGNSWAETCDVYDAGQEYGFRIHAEAADYPYPMSHLTGRWSVAANGTGSEFAINITATPKGNWFMRTLFVMAAKRQFAVILVRLADAWAARMEHEAKLG